jgi:hypothetical protein
MPLPVPLLPAVIVIQPALLVAVQLHPLPAVTVTLPEPPPEPTDVLFAEIEYEQLAPVGVVAHAEALIAETLPTAS